MKAESHGGDEGTPVPPCILKGDDVITTIRTKEFLTLLLMTLQFESRDGVVCSFGDTSDTFPEITHTYSHPGYHLSHLSGIEKTYESILGEHGILITGLRFYWTK